MATTKDLIAQWFTQGQARGATHLIVVCDTYEYEDYPVYVMPGENARQKANEYGRSDSRGLPTLENNQMSKVMEVYLLSTPLEGQLNERRAFHFE